MTDKINELLRRVEEFKPKAAAEIEEFRIKVLGKKGELNALMEEFKTVAPELKRELGQQLNKLKATALDRINALREQLQDAISADGAATEDAPAPVRPNNSVRAIRFRWSEPDRRGLLAAGLHRRRRSRNRG